jgi:hypothetical protein
VQYIPTSLCIATTVYISGATDLGHDAKGLNNSVDEGHIYWIPVDWRIATLFDATLCFYLPGYSGWTISFLAIAHLPHLQTTDTDLITPPTTYSSSSFPHLYYCQERG